MTADASACPACGHRLGKRTKAATVLLNYRVQCPWCGSRCRVDTRLSSGFALLLMFLFGLWMLEYATSGGHIVLVVLFLSTVASLYALIRFAPLRRSG